MNESGFLLFQSIATAIEILLYAGCLTVFFLPFMTRNIEKGKNAFKKSAIIFIIYVAVYFWGINISIYDWLCMAAVIVLLMAVSGFIEMDRKSVFLLTVIFLSIRSLSMLIVESLHFVLSRYFVQGESEIGTILRNAALNYSFITVLQFLMFSLMLYFAGRRLLKKKLELHIKELCYLSLIPIIGILFENIISKLMVVVKKNLIFQLYEQYPLFLLLVPVTAVLFYTCTLITIASYQEMLRLQEEKNKYFVEEQQVHALQERMREVEQFYDGIRQMKHEMRNHLTNIKGLAVSGNYSDMDQYITKMDESMNVFELTIKTGNAVTDVIINDKQKRADKLGIEFKADFCYPVSKNYDAYDIGIIINNLLENGLEACEKMSSGKRYIVLSGKRKKKFFLIKVKNPYDGEVIIDRNTNLPVSTKKVNTSLHGIGLLNVKKEVEKYMGDIDIKVMKNEFCVTVLLQERNL